MPLTQPPPQKSRLAANRLSTQTLLHFAEHLPELPRAIIIAHLDRGLDHKDLALLHHVSPRQMPPPSRPSPRNPRRPLLPPRRPIRTSTPPRPRPSRPRLLDRRPHLPRTRPPPGPNPPPYPTPNPPRPLPPPHPPLRRPPRLQHPSPRRPPTHAPPINNALAKIRQKNPTRKVLRRKKHPHHYPTISYYPAQDFLIQLYGTLQYFRFSVVPSCFFFVVLRAFVTSCLRRLSPLKEPPHAPPPHLGARDITNPRNARRCATLITTLTPRPFPFITNLSPASSIGHSNRTRYTRLPAGTPSPP